MFINDIMENVKGYFREEDLEPVDIKNLDLKVLGYTDLEELKKLLSPLSIENIYLSNGFMESYIYVDYESSIYLELYNLNKLVLTNFVNTKLIYKKVKELIEEKQYYKLYITMYTKMRALDFIKNYKRIPEEDLEDIFLYIYQDMDYNLNIFPKELVNEIFTKMKEKNKNKSNKFIKIYRGEGEKSLNIKEAYSWSTKFSIAYFFATRFAYKNVKIYEGYIRKSDVIHIDNDGGEQEVLCFYEDIKDIKELDFLKVNDETEFIYFYYIYQKKIL